MRLKPIPNPPRTREELWTARSAVPLVPRSNEDCCRRVKDRLDLGGRDEARSWLSFLRALGLIQATADGFHRTTDQPERRELTRKFCERVFGAREVVGVLSTDAGREAQEVFEAVESAIPHWERQRDPGWRDTWCDRVSRLLEWAVLFDIAERESDGYRLTEESPCGGTEWEERQK